VRCDVTRKDCETGVLDVGLHKVEGGQHEISWYVALVVSVPRCGYNWYRRASRIERIGTAAHRVVCAVPLRPDGVTGIPMGIRNMNDADEFTGIDRSNSICWLRFEPLALINNDRLRERTPSTKLECTNRLHIVCSDTHSSRNLRQIGTQYRRRISQFTSLVVRIMIFFAGVLQERRDLGGMRECKEFDDLNRCDTLN
jgi:hypothetical protein